MIKNTNRTLFIRSLTYYLLAIVLLCPGVFPGCGANKLVRNEPDGYTIFPGASRIGRSAWHAVISPLTWAPALGSAAVFFSGRDKRMSDWACSHNPVFGSQTRAGTASNYMLVATGFSALVAMTTQVIINSNNTGELWYPAGVTLISGGLAVGGTGFTITDYIKHKSERHRPDDSDHHSFPSGHAFYSTAFATIASGNIDLIQLSPGYRLAWEAGTYTLAAGTAWTRVEAKKHYLSDVLAGWVLGHFVSQFMCEAFIGTGVDSIMKTVDLQLNPVPGHISLGVVFSTPLFL